MARAVPAVPRLRIAAVAVCAGSLAVFATALALAPAQWAAAAIARASGGHVELAEASGSIWNGSALLVLAAGQGREDARASLPGPLSWHLSPWALLHGTVDLSLEHPSILTSALKLQAHADGRLQIGAVALSLPAAMLAGLGAPWNTVRPGGIVSLRTDGLELEHGQLNGSLVMDWDYASSALTPVSPIGHYRLQTSGSYPGTRVELQTVSGPLELTGSGTIGEGGRLRFEGVARPLAAADAATKTQLNGLISLLGRRDGDTAILNLGS